MILLLSPIGRLVKGSLYTPIVKDMSGNPLVDKKGQPTQKYLFSLAVKKRGEHAWQSTDWGKPLAELAKASFPAGQSLSPQFAWKIADGDSEVPNMRGNKNCDREGFPGNWILNFTTSFPVKITRDNGTKELAEENAVQLGDYIQVRYTAASNGSHQKPGLFLTPRIVNFAGFGKRILIGEDPAKVGFGAGEKPEGLMEEPFDIEPYTELVPTPAAQGLTIEQLEAEGWSREELLRHGVAKQK